MKTAKLIVAAEASPDPHEKLIPVYTIQKRQGIAIIREYKRMVYQAIASN